MGDISKKQNILIVHNYYQIPGGEDTVVANEKKLLEDNGHKVFLYSRNNTELKTMGKIKKLFLPFITIFNVRTYREVKKIIKKENIDIVHVHNTLSLISPSVYYAAFFCKVPVVQTIHNFRLLCPGATFYRDGHICEDCVEHGLKCAVKHNCYRESKLQTLMCVINTKIHRLLGTYKKLNYICLTEFNKQKLLLLNSLGKKQIIDAKRIYVKPNFVKDEGVIIPYENRVNQFIYVGRLDKLKGIDILFEAWKQMGESAPKLLVCGVGPMEKWCEQFLKDNLNCNIELKGFVENDKVKELIANSKALILPTQWYEGFPMTILEAYSVGTPVIGSDIGNVGNLIEKGITGCKFKYNSVESIIGVVKDFDDGFVNIEVIKNLFDKLYSDMQNYRKIKQIYDYCGSAG